MNSRQSLMLIAIFSLVSVVASSIVLFVVFNQEEQIRSLKSKIEKLEFSIHNGPLNVSPPSDPLLKLSEFNRQLGNSVAQIDQVLSRLEQHEINLAKQLARDQNSTSLPPANESAPRKKTSPFLNQE